MNKESKNTCNLYVSFDPWVGKMYMATHSSIPAWEIWTEEPGGLASMGSQRIEHNNCFVGSPTPVLTIQLYN